MRSPFAEKTEEIVPRSLKQLLATEPSARTEEPRRRRPRRTKVRRAT